MGICDVQNKVIYQKPIMNKTQKQKVREEFRKFLQNAPVIKDNLTNEWYVRKDDAENYLIQKLEDQERELVGRIESKEFYDLMQIYRHTPLVEQELVVMAFENVKKFITKNENKR